MASTSTNGVLLAVLFYLLCTTNGDEDMCTLRADGKTSKCLDKLEEGIKCGEESAVSKCFKMCYEKKKDSASYYEVDYKNMKSLDTAICGAKLEKDVGRNKKCLETLFMDCKPLYGKDWNEKGDCKEGKPLLEKCKETVLNKQTSDDCKKFADKLHEFFENMCPKDNGAISTLGANLFAILVAAAFASYFTAMQ